MSDEIEQEPQRESGRKTCPLCMGACVITTLNTTTRLPIKMDCYICDGIGWVKSEPE